tara:strand:- start:5238 stop:5843 length:606 start_codon:yes stop_codon:yes gene_type:complete
MLIIVDNFFEEEIEKELKTIFTENDDKNDETALWSFGHSSIRGDFEFSWLYTELKDNKYFNNYLNIIIQEKLIFCLNKIFNSSINLLSFRLERLYGNGMLYGSQSSFHTDDDDDNAYTFLYFLNDSCNESTADAMGGYFYYKDNGEIKCIEPYSNRAIFFNGNILHKGEAFTRGIDKIRISLVWKFYDEKKHIKSLHEYNK